MKNSKLIIIFSRYLAYSSLLNKAQGISRTLSYQFPAKLANYQLHPIGYNKDRYISMSSPNKAPEDLKNLPKEFWKDKLSEEAYEVTREQGTERAFTGKYYDYKGDGIYACICCGAELFSSKAKYDSGSGWPSFYDALKSAQDSGSETGVILRPDESLGPEYERTEVVCKNCDAHLGHVFDDGPNPTGKRFCINSCALNFKEKK